MESSNNKKVKRENMSTVAISCVLTTDRKLSIDVLLNYDILLGPASSYYPNSRQTGTIAHVDSFPIEYLKTVAENNLNGTELKFRTGRPGWHSDPSSLQIRDNYNVMDVRFAAGRSSSIYNIDHRKLEDFHRSCYVVFVAMRDELENKHVRYKYDPLSKESIKNKILQSSIDTIDHTGIVCSFVSYIHLE